MQFRLEGAMIVSQRCGLTRLVSEDLRDVALLYKEPLVRRYLGGVIDDESQIEKKCKNMLRNSKEKDVYYWCVRSIRDEKFLGLVSLDRYYDGINLELSFEFLPQYWGKGYATEVVQRLIDYSFTELHLPRLVSETQTANCPSCRLLERVGMKEERRLIRFGAEQVRYSIDKASWLSEDSTTNLT
jgi:ribosomal-protein-alanine N-acetyltransferase